LPERSVTKKMESTRKSHPDLRTWQQPVQTSATPAKLSHSLRFEAFGGRRRTLRTQKNRQFLFPDSRI
jgi:hypothetical protein